MKETVQTHVVVFVGVGVVDVVGVVLLRRLRRVPTKIVLVSLVAAMKRKSMESGYFGWFPFGSLDKKSKLKKTPQIKKQTNTKTKQKKQV